MTDGVHDLLEVHACACNGRALETLESWWSPSARCACDGLDAGEGPAAVRRLLAGAWPEDVLVRVVETADGRMLVGFDGAEGRGAPRASLRLEVEDGRVTAVSLDHLDA